MIEALTEPFEQGIGQRALVELVVLGVACGPLGIWVLLFRHGYAAESIAHGMLPGLVIASLAGLPLALGGAGGLLLAAGGIALARQFAAVGPDASVAVVVTFLFGLGSLLALSAAVPLRLGELLFGDPLSVSNTDLAASAALAGLIALGLAVLRRHLSLSGFEAASARSLGGSPARAELALLVALALTTLIAVQALGNLLVVALIVAPAAGALRINDRLGSAIRLAAVLAVASGIGG
ncbi:MAG: metal ABC transporter permease, partial [Solirubrobacterales bacterium]|nr:metal ABC transporter permease [Solirubrobacterales bacterium]